jgi:hypothetical protein
VGLEPERVKMIHISSAMAVQFVDETQKMVEAMRALGPNPLRKPVAQPVEWANSSPDLNPEGVL